MNGVNVKEITFLEQNLAKVYRAMLLTALKEHGLVLPYKMPPKWIVDCEHVGQGLPALKYLSRYLYPGVISNKNIVADDGVNITFTYIDSDTGQTKTRKLAGEDFIALLLQHTLLKGFRRARDFGFLHGNAKKVLRLVQYLLNVILPKFNKPKKPSFKCKICQSELSITGFIKPKPRYG